MYYLLTAGKVIGADGFDGGVGMKIHHYLCALVVSACATAAGAIGQDTLPGRPNAAESVAGNVWESAPLASRMIGVLAEMDPAADQLMIERRLLNELVGLGLADGRLSLDVAAGAFDLLLAGDWSPTVTQALESVAASLASEVSLEELVGVSQGDSFDGPLGPPPAAGPVLVGSDYEG